MNTLTSLISNPQVESLLSSPKVQNDVSQCIQFYNLCSHSSDPQMSGLASDVTQVLDAFISHELQK